MKLDSNYEKYFSKRVMGYMRMNLPLLIEKMNYQIVNDDKKYKIIKRDSDVDSILDVVSNDCAKLLLSYNDIRNNTFEIKKNICKKRLILKDSLSDMQ